VGKTVPLSFLVFFYTPVRLDFYQNLSKTKNKIQALKALISLSANIVN
jgi:hypothetical protein